MKHNRTIRTIFCWSVIAIACLFHPLGLGQSVAVENKQSLEEIRKTVKEFLTKESAGIANAKRINVEVGSLNANLNFAQCASLDTFMPNGSRLWGKTSVGVRCLAPQKWTVYVPATIKVWGNYYVTARAVKRGQTITEDDISPLEGDLTALPIGVITQTNQAVGRTSNLALGAGMPLRQDGLRMQHIVLQGQNIQLVSAGEGFKVSTEGQALNGASEGQVVKVKTNSGHVISGIAKQAGMVEVSN